MELFQTEDFYIFQNKGEKSLWCDRNTGKITAKDAWELTKLGDVACLGLVHGIIGKFHCFEDSVYKLLVIERCSLVGYIRNEPVYCINQVGLLSLSKRDAHSLKLRPCPKHSASVSFRQSNEFSADGTSPASQHKAALAKTWGSIKSATQTFKTTTAQAAAMAQMKPKVANGKEREKLELRLLEEIVKLFSQPDYFYFSPSFDLTNTVLRTATHSSCDKIWQKADDRFFWNKFLLQEFIDIGVDSWIQPVLHGYVHIEKVPIQFEEEMSGKSLTLLLISRRSRFRAGTRYKKRGVDDQGHVANYVETEQCVVYGNHCLSFVQVRGSVPLFWSQPGIKYRPPPVINKGVDETRPVFSLHFKQELDTYNSQCIVNLVEQTGKEKIIGDAYLEQILLLNEPRLTYVTFDFHEHCRGLHFENVNRLVGALEDVIREMRYTWLDSQGLICQQQAVFRVNCMDCLDRTNVVQTAFAREVLEAQLSKLGLLPPEGFVWPALRTAFNGMWANNGDTISRQYAGTNALKGDYTRTGERRLAGMMKDGMNSANRYYLNRFKDTLKQLAIDLVVGHPLPDDILSSLGKNNEDAEDLVLATADRVRQVIEDCRKMWVNPDEIAVGAWGLVDAHPTTGDALQVDMDVILILTRDFLYIVQYDDELDSMVNCSKLPLENLRKMELGPAFPSGKSSKLLALKSPGKNLNAERLKQHQLRIHYLGDSGDVNYAQFRSTKLRFFNNMAVPICNTEDMNESLKAIAETIYVTAELSGVVLPYQVGLLAQIQSAGRRGVHLDLPNWAGFPRNASEGQLSLLKEAGSKALSSMTSHFTRFKTGRSQLQAEKIVADQLKRDAKEDGKSSESDSGSEIPSGVSTPGIQEDFELKIQDLYLSSAGILILVKGKIQHRAAEKSLIKRKLLLRCLSAGNFRIVPKHLQMKSHLPSLPERKNSAAAPEILVSSVDPDPGESNLPRSRHLSQSSELSCSSDSSVLPRASSEQTLPQTEPNIKNSQSEQILKGNLLSSLKFPISNVNLKFMNPSSVQNSSPLSFIAKGVQNLSANLDPRKILETKREVPVTGPKLDDLRKQCSTRIIRV